MNENLRKTFTENLQTLKRQVSEMFEMTTAAYKKMFEALETMDTATARSIIEADMKINRQETLINETGYLVILRQCPVAQDLRMILSAIKTANDLERMADYAKNCATFILKTDCPSVAYNDELLKYKDILMDMLAVTHSAYEAGDVSAALNLTDKDKAIDTMYHEQLDDFAEAAKSLTNQRAKEATRALLVIKQLERAGDHLTNIAEHIVYLRTGKTVELN